MIETQTASLDIARTILTLETIGEVLKHPRTISSHYKILDRWALNTPEKLIQLEQKGMGIFLPHLLNQQELEERTMYSEEYDDMRVQGMSKWEIFSIMGLNTEL